MPELLEKPDRIEKEEIVEYTLPRPERAKLTAEESLKRMEEFLERKEQMIAVVRKSKDRSISCLSF